MKKITIVTSFLLIVIMTVSLTACTVTSSSGVVGNWKTTLDMGKIASKMTIDSVDDYMKDMYEQIIKAYDGVSVDMKLDLTEDKKAKMYFDEASAENAKSKIKENITKLLPEIFKAMGIDDYKSALTMMGLTEEQFLENSMSSIDLSHRFDGTYKIDGNKMYTTKDGEEENTENYFLFEQNGNELKITDAKGSGATMINDNLKDVLLPMIFTR